MGVPIRVLNTLQKPETTTTMNKLALTAALLTTTASAQSWVFQAYLNDTTTPGVAYAWFGVHIIPDPDHYSLQYNINYSGVTPPIASAHIHAGDGTLLVNLPGINSTSISGFTPIPVDTSFTGAYVDIHTAAGDISGPMVQAVPEVNSALLVGCVLGAGAVFSRWRKAA